MADSKFLGIMILLVPQVVQLICDKYLVDEIQATREFYESQVYALLEQEGTDFWHFSPLTLLIMYDSERKTGSFEIPEET